MTIHVRPQEFAIAALTSEGLDIQAINDVTSSLRPMRIAVVNLMGDPEKALIDDLRAYGETGFSGSAQFDSFSPDSRLVEARNITQSAETDADRALEKFKRAEYRLNNHDGFSTLIENLAEYDGVILTGFPREEAELVQKSDASPNGVSFYSEFTDLLDALREQDVPTLATCWSAHVALKHFHGVERAYRDNKTTGVFPVNVHHGVSQITNGLDDTIGIPVSRFGASDQDAIDQNPALNTIAGGDRETIGSAIVTENNGAFIYMTGHLEYGADTLQREFNRDLRELGDAAPVPQFYDIENPERSWADSAKVFYGNILGVFKTRFDTRFDAANDSDYGHKKDDTGTQMAASL